jgi:predicted RNA-binding protein with PUA domain
MKIIICGSMSASKEMVQSEKKLTELGHEVVLPEFTYEYAQMETLSKMHTESARNKVEYDLIRGYFDKIKSGDAILIVNVERKNIPGYIGGNSFLEMGFAHILNKPIYLLNQIPEIGYRDEIEAMNPIVLNGILENIK